MKKNSPVLAERVSRALGCIFSRWDKIFKDVADSKQSAFTLPGLLCLCDFTAY